MIGCALAALVIAAQPLAGQVAPRTAAADVAVGIATSRGDELAETPAFALDLTLARTLKRFVRIGGAMGLRSGGMNGDVCVLNPSDHSRCLPHLAGHLEFAALAGLGIGNGGNELRVLAGPLLVSGDGKPAYGGVLAADGAAGGQSVALVVGVRASTANLRQGGRYTSRQGTLGIRFRY